jgi:putative transposase
VSTKSSQAHPALRRGGHRSEPGDVTLRDEALRHPARLPSVAARPRHRPASQGVDGRRARDPRRARPEGLPLRRGVLAGIRSVHASNPFAGEGYRKVWARLRHEHGVRTSMRRVLRTTREHGILAQDRPTGVRGPDTHDRTITTAKPDEIWAIDATGCLTDEGSAAVFVIVDHCTGEWLGLREAVHLTKGRYEDRIATDTKLRHNHGSQFISHAFQDELKTFGVESSPSFVRQPEGNGCVERFIRTLKEQLRWLHRFRTVEELNQALRDFARRFKNHWIIGRMGYRTPAAHRRIFLAEAA